MAIDFPNSPTNGQIYTVGDKSWIWDGTVWKAYGASLSPTTLKVDSTNNRVGINNQSPAYTLDVNGTVEATQFLQGTDYLSPYQGFRNKIINGGFDIWQRGTSRTFMQAGQYLADRWTIRLYQQSGHQRTNVTPVAGMQTRYALRSSSSTTAEVGGGTRMWATTVLESADSIPLRGQTMTLSFWVRFSNATCSSSTATPYGNWSGGIQWNTSTTDASVAITGVDGDSNVTLTNGSFPTTWTKYTVTTTIPSNANNVGIQFGFSGLGSTASADTVWYEITQVQLEQGSVATPFEQRPIVTELALCQRYFQQVPAVICAATNGGLGNSYFQTMVLSPDMRTTPTITFYPQTNYGGTAGNVAMYPTGSSLSAGIEFSNSKSFALNKTGTNTYTLGVFSYKADAEL